MAGHRSKPPEDTARMQLSPVVMDTEARGVYCASMTFKTSQASNGVVSES